MASVSLSKVRKQLMTLKARHQEHAKRGMGLVVDSLSINAASTLAGYVQGRYGGYKLFGHIPFELVGMGALYGFSVFGPKRMSHTSANLGHGFSAAYTTTLGRGFGKQQRAKAGGKPLLQGVSDGLDELMGSSEGGGALSMDDLIRQAERV